MYNESALYYLNQIGIRPWVRKDVFSPKLLVLIPAKQSKKAQKLVQKMLDFIELPKNEVILVKEAQEKHFHNPSLCAVWALGIAIQEEISHCPVFSSHDPEFLLTNPSEKKKVFEDIVRIKEVI